MISGIEVEGPVLMCYNFESAGNRIHTQTSQRLKLSRAKHSLQKKNKSTNLLTTWRFVLRRLYPTLLPAYAHKLAAALNAWSNKLNVCKQTHPAIKRWPLLFTATVTSHMATGGAKDSAGAEIIPNSPELAKCELKHHQYKTFGLMCRDMSNAWRQIRAAALTDSGVILPARAFRMET